MTKKKMMVLGTLGGGGDRRWDAIGTHGLLRLLRTGKAGMLSHNADQRMGEEEEMAGGGG